MGFQTRFLLYILPLVVLVPVGYLLFYAHRTTTMLEQDLHERGFLLARNVAQAAEIGLLARDETLFGSLLDGVSRERDVTHVFVYDFKGKPFARVNASHVNETMSEDALRILLNEKAQFQQRYRDAAETTIYEFFHPIFANSLDDAGRVVGFSRVGVSTAHILHERDANLLTTLLMTAAFIAFGSLTALLLARGITRPVRALTEGVEAISRGNLDRVVAVQSKDEIGRFAAAFNFMTTALRQRTAELVRRNEDMRLVLDHVDQGLVTIDREGRMSSERSAQFDEWFGSRAAGTSLWELLGPSDSSQIEQFKLGYEQLLEDILPLELAMDQLPKGFSRGDRRYDLSLVPIMVKARVEGALIVASDITAERKAREAAAVQHEQLVLLEHAIRDRFGWAEFFDEASSLVEGLRRGSFTDRVECARAIHTIKGNAAQFGVTSVSEAAHRLEQAYLDGHLSTIAIDTQRLLESWDVYAVRATALLGEPSGTRVEMTEEELSRLLDIVRERRPYGEIERLLAQVRDEPIRRRFQRIARQIAELSQRMGKGKPEVIMGGADIRLPNKKYAPFWANFVHIVRNVVDHGFETPEERLREGKPAQNRVTLSAAEVVSRGVVIEIADDGRGIDWARIRDAAALRGVRCSTQKDLVNALFAPGVSTAETLTLVSGRGFGMAGVLDACSALGGVIEVESQRHKGSLFRFTFPREAAWRDPIATSTRSERASRLVETESHTAADASRSGRDG